VVKFTVNTDSFAALNMSTSSVLVTFLVSEKTLPLYISQFKISRDIVRFYEGFKEVETKTLSASTI
jgi:hypothetical protein